MTLRYDLTLFCWHEGLYHHRVVRSLSLSRAWKLAIRHARRSRNRYGGTVHRANWGLTGGQFPSRYGIALITLSRPPCVTAHGSICGKTGLARAGCGVR